MDMEFVKQISTLGVGGAIAGLLFLFYRKDVALYTAQWRGQSEQLIQVVKENTVAITTNTEVTKSMHKRLDQISAAEDRRMRRAGLTADED